MYEQYPALRRYLGLEPPLPVVEHPEITDNVLRKYLGLDAYNPQQPRDENGRWTSGNKSVAGGKNRDKVRRRRKIIKLSEQEFAEVQSAFMTDVTKEERQQELLFINYGNYVYEGVLREDGTRDIIGKRRNYNV